MHGFSSIFLFLWLKNDGIIRPNDFSETYTGSSPFCKYSDPPSPRNLNLTPNNSYHNRSVNSLMNGSLIGEGLIQDEAELQTYLKDLVDRERKSTHSTNMDQPSNLLSSFWSHPATRNPAEVSPMLRRCVYQMAPTVGETINKNSSKRFLAERRKLSILLAHPQDKMRRKITIK